MTEPKKLTTAHGAPVGDNQNALTAGPRGPLLLQDYQLLKKMATFNRERVPVRVVHAKGSGAYGTFTVTFLQGRHSPDFSGWFQSRDRETPGALSKSLTGESRPLQRQEKRPQETWSPALDVKMWSLRRVSGQVESGQGM